MTDCSILKLVPERKQFFFRVVSLLLGIAMLAVVAGCQTEPIYVGAPSASTNSLAGIGTKRLTKAAAPIAGESFVFRAGDVVTVSFPSSPTLNTTQQIRTDGKISLPLIGEVQAAGLTTTELQDRLRKLYAPQLSSKQITVEAQNVSFSVYVTGAVLHPGKVTADHPLTALDAIMETGGFDYNSANTKGVVVIRQEGKGTKNYKLNLKRVMEGRKTQSFYLKRGDIIYVPQRFTWF